MRTNLISASYILFIFLAFIGIFNIFVFYRSSYYGNEFVLLYFFFSISIVYLSIYLLDLNAIKNKIFLIFIFYKLPITLFLMQLLFTRYEGGDLPGYYFQVVDKIFNLNDFDFYFFNVGIIQFFNFVLYQILPNSLWGTSFFYGAISFIAYLIIYSIFRKFSFNNRYLFILLFLIPTITMQSSFFGKDGYSLLFLSIFFLSFYKYYYSSKIYLFLAIFMIFLIGLIRLYQGAVLLVALYLFFIGKNRLRFFIGSCTALVVSLKFFKYFIEFLLPFIDIDNFNFVKVLSTAYAGGSLMLDPFVFPFNMLQIFRPFPWEANNMFLFYVSLENLFLFSFLIFLFLKKKQEIIYRIKTLRIYRFLFFYVLTIWFIFSFDPNMGDLVRRKIYIVPFLIILLL